jgi:hypothetical protein
VFKLLSAFAGRLAGAVEVVVTVGVGGAVMVIGGVVLVGAGGATEAGDGGMVPGRGARIPVTPPNAGDGGMVATRCAFNVAGIVEPTTRTVDVGTTAIDATLAASRAACVCMALEWTCAAAREWTAIW